MFSTTLLIIAQKWKQFLRLSRKEWVNKMEFTCNRRLLAVKKERNSDTGYYGTNLEDVTVCGHKPVTNTVSFPL